MFSRPWIRCTDPRCEWNEEHPVHEHPGGLAVALVEIEAED